MWYLARWGKIRQINVVQETAHRVKVMMSNGRQQWMHKQSSETRVCKSFDDARQFLIDLHKGNIERLQDGLEKAKDDLARVEALTLKDTEPA